MKHIKLFESFDANLIDALAKYKESFEDYCKDNERDQTIKARAEEILNGLSAKSEQDASFGQLFHKWLTAGSTLELQALLRKLEIMTDRWFGGNSKEQLLDFNAFTLLDSAGLGWQNRK